MIDWTNPSDQVTEHFTVQDCLMMHNWNRLATEDDGADFDKLIQLCQKLEQVRGILGCPMNVHCIYRSPAYNLSQGILPPTGADVHSFSEAIDFDCGDAMSIDDIHTTLLPQLESLGLRMEQNTPTWCHLDLHPVIHNRYFSV